jgi:hypothetical protein
LTNQTIQAYRCNNRKMTDGGRIHLAIKGIVGKRVTFDELTGKEQGSTSVN